MADGEVRVKLDADTERRLNAIAEAAGQSVDGYVADLIADHLAVEVGGADDDWAESIRIAEDYDRTGVSYSLEEGMAAFDAAVQRRLESKR